jgi:hypothetical protein
LATAEAEGIPLVTQKIKEVRQFIWVRRPVSGFARGEMVEVLTFHRFEDFSSSRRNKFGSPVSVLGVIVTTGEESWSKGAESTRNIKIIMFLGSKVRLVRKADNLTAIYEPIVETVWDP